MRSGGVRAQPDCVAFRAMPGEVVWALERGSKTVSVPIRARFTVTSHLLAREAALAGARVRRQPDCPICGGAAVDGGPD